MYDKDKKKAWKKEHRRKNPWLNYYEYIHRRCNNKATYGYSWYGGRGIKRDITTEELKTLWFRDRAYEMKKASIDRIDKNLNYTFENCRFIEHTVNCGKDKFKAYA